MKRFWKQLTKRIHIIKGKRVRYHVHVNFFWSVYQHKWDGGKVSHDKKNEPTLISDSKSLYFKMKTIENILSNCACFISPQHEHIKNEH